MIPLPRFASVLTYLFVMLFSHPTDLQVHLSFTIRWGLHFDYGLLLAIAFWVGIREEVLLIAASNALTIWLMILANSRPLLPSASFGQFRIRIQIRCQLYLVICIWFAASSLISRLIWALFLVFGLVVVSKRQLKYQQWPAISRYICLYMYICILATGPSIGFA